MTKEPWRPILGVRLCEAGIRSVVYPSFKVLKEYR